MFTPFLSVLPLALVLLVCLSVIPLGIPGLWLMIVAGLLYNLIVGQAAIGWIALFGTALLGGLAELIEFLLAGRFARKFGGSKRAEWGAILGGVLGVVIGLPIPVIGSVLGGFAGAFAGALIAEWSLHQDHDKAGKVAWGALLGRATAIGIKMAIGFVIAVWLVTDAAINPARPPALPEPADAHWQVPDRGRA